MLVAAATVLPLVYLGVRVVDAGWDRVAAIVFRPRTWNQLGTSVALMVGVTAVSMTLGIGTAVLLTRVRLPGARWWWVASALPIAVPSYVAAFALLVLAPTVHGLLPTIAVIALTTYPYVTLPVVAASLRADHALADVARTLGVARVRTFVTITLPQLLPAAAAGGLLCALYALADFATPAMLRTDTLTVGVYALFTGSLNRASAASLSLVLVGLAITVVAVEQLVRHNAAAKQASVPVRRVPPARLGRTGTALALLAVATPIVLAVAVPVGALFGRWLAGSRYSTAASDLGAAALTSLGLAVATALIATAAALPVAVLSARSRRWWVRATEAASFVGQALPGVVIALSLVFMSLALVPFAYQTLGLLIACYVILFLPKAIGAARSSIEQVPAALGESARTLGRTATSAWWTITAPAAVPGLAAGALLVSTATIKEVPATLMLRPIGVDTVATELWSKTSIGAYGAAAPAALLLVAVGLVPALLLSRTVRP